MADDALPRALGPVVLQARMRGSPEDFRVDEVDGFEPSGSGEHLLLDIEKRGMNTGFAAKRIAEWAGVPESAIGYAGMKDRHAVTRQRFSVHLPGREAPDVAGLQDDALRVLGQARHARKLPRGALAGNRFDLVLRDVQGDADAIDTRLRAIASRGVPNYFGEQRFGHGGGNVAEALAMFDVRRVRREQRGLLLSAARSELFNRVWPPGSRKTAGTAPWMARPGYSMATAACSDRCHSTTCWLPGSGTSTSTRADRCGAAASCGPAMSRSPWSARSSTRRRHPRWPTAWSAQGCARNGAPCGCVRPEWTGCTCRPACCASIFHCRRGPTRRR